MAVLTTVGLVTRSPIFGNPIAHIDDQFYLLVGHSILHGQLPYIDIWDRKPVGLFLIYAAIAALGGNMVLNVQLVATVFAVATAFVIVCIGSRLTTGRGPLFGGIVYLVMLPGLGGGSGQSPVFYNLFMAVAGLLTLKAIQETDPVRRPPSIQVMALAGAAMLVKPVALFEGCWFGVALLSAEWRNTRSVWRVAPRAMQMILVALLPTTAAFGAYAAFGHFNDIWGATVTSVLGKAPLPAEQMLSNLMLMFRILVLALGFAIASNLMLRWSDSRSALFMAGWLFFAIVGVASVPNFYEHYGLPLLVPVCVLLTPVLSLIFLGWIAFAMLLLWSALWLPVYRGYVGFSRARDFNHVAEIVRRHLNGGCLYVYEGPVQLYTATGACTVTRFLFPDHLNSVIEEKALPVNQQEELRRILAKRPAVIAERNRVYLAESYNSRRILNRELSLHYRLLTTAWSGSSFTHPLRIWVRRQSTGSKAGN